jgi:hypothetical protein
MMELAIAFVSLAVILAVAAVIRYGSKVPPETMIVGVRKGGHPWIKFHGTLLDARIEQYDFAALENGEIVDVKTGRKTGRKIVTLKK